jgi:hypothetical protein
MPKIVCDLYGFKKEMEIPEERLREFSVGGLKLRIPIELSTLVGNVGGNILNTVKMDWLDFEYGGYIIAEEKHYFHLDKKLQNKIEGFLNG